jgi:hypothetical protein
MMGIVDSNGFPRNLIMSDKSSGQSLVISGWHLKLFFLARYGAIFSFLNMQERLGCSFQPDTVKVDPEGWHRRHVGSYNAAWGARCITKYE